MNVNVNDCVTKREAAEILGVTLKTVFNMHRRGDLRFLRFANNRRSVFIPKIDVEQILSTPIPGDNYARTRSGQYSELEPEKAN
ncbi:MAG: helix-turn-helix domain-containing protein [Calditrichaeota bacterium]|nr:helix-turn-helix domain-containing protein [Calditrichota bacterium]